MTTVTAPAPDLLAVWGEPTPRVRVRDALRRLVAEPGWPFANWTVLQNRLLDEVGSDLRPLAALLVRAGEGGLVEQLPARRDAWPAARGSLVVSLTAHTFLQPEMARWAVECWGYAFGVADEAELTAAADARVAQWREAERQQAERQAEAVRAAEAAAARAHHAAQAQAARTDAHASAGARSAPRAPARTPVAAAAPAVVAPTSLAPAPAVPQWPTRALTPAPGAHNARRRGRWPHGLDNPVAHLSLVGIVGFVGYVVYSAVRMPAARANEVPAGLARTADGAAPSARTGVGSAGAPGVAGIPGITTNGLPQTAADSARMIRVSPARRPTFAMEQGGAAPLGTPPPAPAPMRTATLGASPAVPPTPPPAAPAPAPAPRPALIPNAPDGYDRLRLRTGQVLRGRVELVRVSALVFRDADTGLRYEYPKADVDAVVTEFGTTVRFAAAGATPAVGGSPADRASARLVRRGLGGRYEVTFSVVSIAGSPECRRAWQAPPRADWARVTHVPGADTLAIAFEGGSTFASVVDQEAQFASTFVIVPDQAYSGQALTTRLNGRFAEGGFDAAVNLVGYRRVREGRDVACHTVLRALGRRTGA